MTTASPPVSGRSTEYTPPELRLRVFLEEPRAAVDPIALVPEPPIECVRRWLEEEM